MTYKFNFIYGIPGNVAGYFDHTFTLSEISEQAHWKVLRNCNYRREVVDIVCRIWTGGLDRDGEEIYLGDITESNRGGWQGIKDVHLVDFVDGVYTNSGPDVKVIGNRWMNPEYER